MHVAVVVPDGWDNERSPSGGNRYDQRLVDELRRAGVRVSVHDGPLAGVPDGAVALVDGLVGSAAPDDLVALATRARVVVLAHLPFGMADPAARRAEHAAFRAVHGVVVPSRFAADWLLREYALDPARVHVAPPGVDPVPAAPGTPHGGALLCVAAVHPGKGHDVLVEALARVRDLPWGCTCVGPLDRDPGHVRAVRAALGTHGLAGRVELAGPRAGDDLERVWRDSDLLVLPTRAETYGMAVAEALAHGIPALVSDVGGVREALGDGGTLVPAGDVGALADALREWLTRPGWRAELRRRAAGRRAASTGWDATAGAVLAALR